MAAGMTNILNPNVGSGATYQPVIGSGNSSSSSEAFALSIKQDSTSNLVKSLQLIITSATKKLQTARENLLKTDRAALRQEVREIEAILSGGDFSVKVRDLPNTRWFGQKWKNELVKEAREQIDIYNSTVTWVYSLTKNELVSRGVDLTNLSAYNSTDTEQEEAEKLYKALTGVSSESGTNSLLDGLSGEIRAIETTTGLNRYVLGLLALFLFVQTRKKSRKRR